MTRPRAAHVVLAVTALVPCLLLFVGMVSVVTLGVLAWVDGGVVSPLRHPPHLAFDSIWLAVIVVVPVGIVLGAWLSRSSPGVLHGLLSVRCLDACANVPTGLLGGAVGVWVHAAGLSVDVAAVALAAVTLPAMVLRVAHAVGEAPRELEEAALALGASRTRTFVHVTLAHTWKPVMACALRALARIAGESVAVMVAVLASTGSAAAARAQLAARVGPVSFVLTMLAVTATLAAAQLEERAKP